MKVIKCRWMPKRYCMNLFGLYLAKDTSWIDSLVINHERIHDLQQSELLYIPFYLLYILEWIFRLCQYRNANIAYRNISFEREAYGNAVNPEYPSQRRHYAWIHYLRRRI